MYTAINGSTLDLITGLIDDASSLEGEIKTAQDGARSTRQTMMVTFGLALSFEQYDDVLRVAQACSLGDAEEQRVLRLTEPKAVCNRRINYFRAVLGQLGKTYSKTFRFNDAEEPVKTWQASPFACEWSLSVKKSPKDADERATAAASAYDFSLWVDAGLRPVDRKAQAVMAALNWFNDQMVDSGVVADFIQESFERQGFKLD